MSGARIERVTITAGGPATVWTGGAGDPLVLVHGGWGGAAAHWSPVWEGFAREFRVIAPELPGFAVGIPPGPRSFGAFARWVERLLDAMSAPSAWLVGNSFGSMVASRIAAQSPHRCRGLVIVNGGVPPPGRSALSRWLVARTPLGRLRRAAIGAVLRRLGYGPSTLARAFADPARAPAEIASGILAVRSPQGDLAADALAVVDEPLPPLRVPTLLVWGEADRLLGTDVRAARKLQRSLPGAGLVLVPGAGHLPQVECPAEFSAAVVRFVGAVRASPPGAAA